MAATAGTDTLTTTEATFFADANGATSVLVKCTSGTALINVPGLHASGEYFPIASGSEYTFRLNHLGIKKITGKTASGSAAITFGVLSKTGPEY